MNLIGQHVNWTKLKGKPNSSMQETKGFGCLNQLELGERMCIAGDYGVTTTEVESIASDGDSITVKTRNSIYRIEAW